MKKIITVAILGCGSRGVDSYGKYLAKDERFKVVSGCDIRQIKLDRMVEVFGIDRKDLFLDENDFFLKKRADVCIIATQDQDHVRHAIKALELGYDLLLEKPITFSKEECFKLLDAQKKYGGKVLVCHVLRYNPYYRKVYELIEEGKIGKLINIDALEQVAFWHQAHSFVRGNWRNSETTSPMILAKCCHDMDLLQWFAGSKFKSISSFGDLTFFKKENQPEGASDRCQNCKYKDTCAYSAEWDYVTFWKRCGSAPVWWPGNVVCTDSVMTEEGLRKAYENSPWYGRCVFACDNNVVDHQETNILFENGVTASLCMTAFTGEGGRIYRFHGTLGEIDLDEERAELQIKVFGKDTETISFNKLGDMVTAGHGGGDLGIINSLYDTVVGKAPAQTALVNSIESHLMCIAAEESRLKEGEIVKHQ